MRFKTNCRLCTCRCGVLLEIEDDKIVSIEGDADSHSRGFLCRRGEHFKISRDFNKPLIKGSDGSFYEAEWDEALDFAASKLKSVLENGPEGLAVHSGDNNYTDDFSDIAKNFLNAFGSPNFSDSGSYCRLAKDTAGMLLYGDRASKPNLKEAETIVLWGSNPKVSNPKDAEDMRLNLERGAKLVVIDPAVNRLAESADLYIQIRPGSDGALALGVLNILFERGAVDENFWRANSEGFDEFREYVKEFDIINTQVITWAEEKDIIALADIYEKSNTLASSIGVSLELQTNAVESIRAVMALDALPGFHDKKGCNEIYRDYGVNRVEIKSDIEAVGAKEFPIINKFFGMMQSMRLRKAISNEESYKVSSLIVHNTNPAVTFPNTNEFVKAIEKLDFLMVIDVKTTKTAEYADIVFPKSSMYERKSVISFTDDGKQYVKLCERAVEPEIMTEAEIFTALADRLGIQDKLQFKTEDEIIDFKLKDIDHDFNSDSDFCIGEYEENKVMRTPSGKLELSSSILADYGYAPLIQFSEPNESMLTNMPNPEFIFTATTGTRSEEYETLDDGRKVRTAKADKAVFKKFHKEDGDLVTISSPRGSIETVLRLTDRLCPNTLSIPQSSDEQNPNVLVDDEVLDSISGYPGCRSFLIKLDHHH